MIQSSSAVDTLHINEALAIATKEEYGNLLVAWARVNFPPRLITKQTQVQETEFDLNLIKGQVKITKAVTIPPFETIHVPGLTECNSHFKRVHVMMEASERFNHGAVKTICAYSRLKLGSSRVLIGLKNLSCKSVTIKSKTVVATVAAANLVPMSMAPNLEGEGKEVLRKWYKEQIDPKTVQEAKEQKDELTSDLKLKPLSPEKERLLFEKIDLSRIADWDQEDKRQVREYDQLFTLDDLDLGYTSVVKHEIKLNDYTPLKDRYRHIPPHQYEEVKKHLKEMLEIGAIRKSNNPWASAVVLVRKKDGSLILCINLCWLNSHAIKDAYS